jgi:hypothetical protein
MRSQHAYQQWAINFKQFFADRKGSEDQILGSSILGHEKIQSGLQWFLDITNEILYHRTLKNHKIKTLM